MASQKQLAKLKAEFIARRQELLDKRVGALQLQLFDKIFTEYLASLKTDGDTLSQDEANYNLVHNLDKIYQQFNLKENIDVFKVFIADMQSVTDYNIKYFANIDSEKTKAFKKDAIAITNKALGLNEDGSLIKNGYADKFIRNESVLKKIKKITNKAISSRQDFVSFRKDLKEYITGTPEGGGALKQYYGNNAYDTYHKVNELASDKLADNLQLEYFIYSGGLKPTSRPFCVHYDGRIVHAPEFAALTYEDLSENMRKGIPDGSPTQGVWDPMLQRGGFRCNHQKDWITNVVADKYKSQYNKQAADAKKEFYKNQDAQ